MSSPPSPSWQRNVITVVSDTLLKQGYTYQKNTRNKEFLDILRKEDGASQFVFDVRGLMKDDVSVEVDGVSHRVKLLWVKVGGGKADIAQFEKAILPNIEAALSAACNSPIEFQRRE